MVPSQLHPHRLVVWNQLELSYNMMYCKDVSQPHPSLLGTLSAVINIYQHFSTFINIYQHQTSFNNIKTSNVMKTIINPEKSPEIGVLFTIPPLPYGWFIIVLITL